MYKTKSDKYRVLVFLIAILLLSTALGRAWSGVLGNVEIKGTVKVIDQSGRGVEGVRLRVRVGSVPFFSLPKERQQDVVLPEIVTNSDGEFLFRAKGVWAVVENVHAPGWELWNSGSEMPKGFYGGTQKAAAGGTQPGNHLILLIVPEDSPEAKQTRGPKNYRETLRKIPGFENY